MPWQQQPSHWRRRRADACAARTVTQSPHLGALALEGHRAVGSQAEGEDQHRGGAVDAAHNLSHVLRAGSTAGAGRVEGQQQQAGSY